ncbi:type III pantothenate kinase [Methylophaga sp. OBS4]|uniref:type III pantothenate kinase n=1 Tax=Methylophaga sp. OBS4 TaxID=2991935 RepID=UPI00224E08A2|nr:type III pantothenate kinase [Methylophaga sp. OBS4]MCX4188215.1 type III pantothenate kinase [Methylophaga sp. OBS4]
MKLLVDIGNSRVKWTCVDKDGIAEGQSFQRSKTGIKASLNKAWKALTDISAVYVANVAGDKLAEQLTDWTEKQWQLTPKFVSTEKKRFGVTNAYEDPEKLGIDRWLSLIAARQHARQAQCIIDCGTAITIDIVTKTGVHKGGMILPGLGLMRSSLAANANALTEETDEQEFATLATNTFSAIQAGTLYSVTATLERIINDLKDNFDDHIRFIITGGDAEQLLPLLSDEVTFYPDIVLKGLAFYARQDDKKPRHSNKDKQVQQQDESASTADTTVTADKKPRRSNTPKQTPEKNESAEIADSTVTTDKKPRRRSKSKQAQKNAAADNQDPTLPEKAI